MAKKKRASEKPRLPKPSRPKAPREESSASVPPVNLEKALRDSGVREERIPEALMFLRDLSDEQAGPDRATAAPMPADPGSPKESRGVEAMREFIKEKAEWERRQVEWLAVGKAAALQIKRAALWQLETAHTRDLPRPSHVGRALHEKGAVKESKATDYINVYEYLADVKPSPLPAHLHEMVYKVRYGIPDPTLSKEKRRRLIATASCRLTRHMDIRRQVLVGQLGYAQQKVTSKTTLTWLTAIGRKVFKGWPDWGS